MRAPFPALLPFDVSGFRGQTGNSRVFLPHTLIKQLEASLPPHLLLTPQPLKPPKHLGKFLLGRFPSLPSLLLLGYGLANCRERSVKKKKKKKKEEGEDGNARRIPTEEPLCMRAPFSAILRFPACSF